MDGPVRTASHQGKHVRLWPACQDVENRRLRSKVVERNRSLIHQVLSRLEDCTNVGLVQDRQELAIGRDLHWQDSAEVLQVLFPAILAKLQTVDDHSACNNAGYVDIDELVGRIRGDQHARIAFDRAAELNLSELLVHLDLFH